MDDLVFRGMVGMSAGWTARGDRYYFVLRPGVVGFDAFGGQYADLVYRHWAEVGRENLITVMELLKPKHPALYPTIVVRRSFFFNWGRMARLMRR